jgi:hypothetical protein
VLNCFCHGWATILLCPPAEPSNRRGLPKPSFLANYPRTPIIPLHTQTPGVGGTCQPDRNLSTNQPLPIFDFQFGLYRTVQYKFSSYPSPFQCVTRCTAETPAGRGGVYQLCTYQSLLGAPTIESRNSSHESRTTHKERSPGLCPGFVWFRVPKGASGITRTFGGGTV